MAVAPDRRVEALGGERIARRRGAVIIEAQHLAERRSGILRRRKLLTLAVGEEQMAVGREGDAPRIMAVAIDLGRGAEDHRYAVEPCPAGAFDQRAAGERHALAALPGLGEAEIDPPVPHETRMEDDVHQRALARTVHRRDAGDGDRLLSVGGDQQHPPVLFGYQHPPVGQEGHRPGRIETGDHHRREGLGREGPRVGNRGLLRRRFRPGSAAAARDHRPKDSESDGKGVGRHSCSWTLDRSPNVRPELALRAHEKGGDPKTDRPHITLSALPIAAVKPRSSSISCCSRSAPKRAA